MTQPLLSIIIPIGPNEHGWVDLVHDLALLPAGTEIIFSTIRQYTGLKHAPALARLQDKKVKWTFAHPGRAHLLNAGAKEAEHSFLWFIHADTRFNKQTVRALLQSVQSHPNHLHYANLKYNSYSKLFIFNQVGAWLRSQLCNLVVGQQTMCVSQKKFKRIGAFSTQLSGDEDMIFCINAIAHRIMPRAINGYVTTRTRHYENEGWFKLTVKRFIKSLHYVPAAGWLSFKSRLRFLN